MNRDAENRTEGELALQEDLLEVRLDAHSHKMIERLFKVMPAVEEANSISEALDRMVKFEMVLVSPEALGKEDDWGRSQVYSSSHNTLSPIAGSL